MQLEWIVFLPASYLNNSSNMVLSHIRGNELNSPTFGSFPIWFGVTGLNIFFLLFAWILFFLTIAFGPYIYGFVRISDSSSLRFGLFIKRA